METADVVEVKEISEEGQRSLVETAGELFHELTGDVGANEARRGCFAILFGGREFSGWPIGWCACYKSNNIFCSHKRFAYEECRKKVQLLFSAASASPPDERMPECAGSPASGIAIKSCDAIFSVAGLGPAENKAVLLVALVVNGFLEKEVADGLAGDNPRYATLAEKWLVSDIVWCPEEWLLGLGRIQ